MNVRPAEDPGIVESVLDAMAVSERSRAAQTPAAQFLRDHYGLTNQQALTLLCLYKAGGKMVTFDELMDAMSSQANPELVKVRISQVRAVLPEESVESVWGRGYRLSERGLMAVQVVMEGVA